MSAEIDRLAGIAVRAVLQNSGSTTDTEDLYPVAVRAVLEAIGESCKGHTSHTLAAAKSIASGFGVILGEECGFEGAAEYCESETCPGTLSEDHDAQYQRNRLVSAGRFAVAFYVQSILGEPS